MNVLWTWVYTYLGKDRNERPWCPFVDDRQTKPAGRLIRTSVSLTHRRGTRLHQERLDRGCPGTSQDTRTRPLHLSVDTLPRTDSGAPSTRVRPLGNLTTPTQVWWSILRRTWSSWSCVEKLIPSVYSLRKQNGRDKNSWETECYDDRLDGEQRRGIWTYKEKSLW